MLGEVAEWSNAPDSKSGIRLYRIVGSNPTLSAKQAIKPLNFKGFFVFCVSDIQNDYQRADRVIPLNSCASQSLVGADHLHSLGQDVVLIFVAHPMIGDQQFRF